MATLTDPYFGYDPEDVEMKSPALMPITVRLQPCPPADLVNLRLHSEGDGNLARVTWNSLEENWSNYAKSPAVQDSFLLLQMAPNYPEIAMKAGGIEGFGAREEHANFFSEPELTNNLNAARWADTAGSSVGTLAAPRIHDKTPTHDTFTDLVRLISPSNLPLHSAPQKPSSKRPSFASMLFPDIETPNLPPNPSPSLRLKNLPEKETISVRANKAAKTRWGLPLTLASADSPATVMACADTGSEENIISADLARLLGLMVENSTGEQKQFMLANGKNVQAIGKITARCSFGVESASFASYMTCVFHVFVKLASPIIMGMAFLEQTETMTKHRDRLVRIPRPSLQALQVYSVGRPKRDLLCYVDNKPTVAIPDSGSEVDLMSPRFAAERGFQVLHGEELVEFADGSIAVTSGLVRAELAVGDVESTIPESMVTRIPAVDFFLLDGLRPDVLVGEDSLEELKVFTENQNSLVSACGEKGPSEVFRIRHFGGFDKLLSWVKQKIGRGRGPQHEGSRASDIDDQRENDRREREVARIARLPSEQQESAIDAERLRQDEYDHARQNHLRLLPPRSQSPSVSASPESSEASSLYHGGIFKCDHPGCNAPPFQTQYLLNSHTNVHCSARPHFCPVPGCPRAEGGRGFKRKNEMIRHGLVHDTPGYVCPFCPDREHKYPRPDNFQRHVRVHHPDKSHDDPLLKAVLTQPPSPPRLRRRREGVGRNVLGTIMEGPRI